MQISWPGDLNRDGGAITAAAGIRLPTEGRSMSEFPHLLYYTAVLSGCAGILYTGALFVVALISVLATTPQRRRDARTTLTILLGRRPR
jgi:hypothetical protein